MHSTLSSSSKQINSSLININRAETQMPSYQFR